VCYLRVWPSWSLDGQCSAVADRVHNIDVIAGVLCKAVHIQSLVRSYSQQRTRRGFSVLPLLKFVTHD